MLNPVSPFVTRSDEQSLAVHKWFFEDFESVAINLVEIKRCIDQLELAGRATSLHRTTYARLKQVFAQSVRGEHLVFPLNDLKNELEVLEEQVSDMFPRQSELDRARLGESIQSISSLIKADDSLGDPLRLFGLRLLSTLSDAIDEHALTGTFDAQIALDRLTSFALVAEAKSERSKLWSEARQTLVTLAVTALWTSTMGQIPMFQSSGFLQIQAPASSEIILDSPAETRV